MSKHDKLVNKYSKPSNIDFINEDIYRIVKEQSLCDTFGICSFKTPDLIYFGEYNTYVGEVKGRYTYRNKEKAANQVHRYYRTLKNSGIYTVPFVIVGNNYKRVFLHGF